MTTIPAAATITAAPTTDRGRRVRRIAGGASIIGAGVITLAGYLTAPWEGGATQAEYIRSLTDHPASSMLSMILLHFGYLLLVPTAFVLARLARQRAPWLAGIGLTFAVLGSGLSAVVLTDAYDLSLGQHLTMAQALAVENGMSIPGFIAIGLTSTVGTIVGSVLLMVALWRAKWASWLPAVATLAGWAVAYGAHDFVRACTGAALITIGLVAVGVRVLRSSDEQFATGTPA